MSKKNTDFFKEKKPWSEVKDELLGCYLKPYVQKILHTRRPLIYVDCFAGKGKFDDGKPGSPIIALDIMENCIRSTSINKWHIKPYFIELNHATDLRFNLKDYEPVNIVAGKYEDEILKILKTANNCNVFLYIDPYGIKALDCNLFDSFASQYDFNSIEMLINMNSFGFIREACRVFGIKFENEDLFEYLIEYEPTFLSSDDKSINALNTIAGGNYWIDIINEYKQGNLSIYETENRFSAEYCERLRKSYKYVLNMPIQIKAGLLPKYRMIYASNHPEGCIIMADNICNRWELLRDIQKYGQQTLWGENIDNEILFESEIRDKVLEHISSFNRDTRLKFVLADFFSVYGVLCPTKTLKSIYKSLEKDGFIHVSRFPATTCISGKPSNFFTDEKDKYVMLRYNR